MRDRLVAHWDDTVELVGRAVAADPSGGHGSSAENTVPFREYFSINPYWNWSWRSPPGNNSVKKTIFNEFAAAFSHYSSFDQAIVPTAFPQNILAALATSNRPRAIKMVMHFGQEEYGDFSQLLQPDIMTQLQAPLESGIHLLTTTASLAQQYHELGIPAESLPYYTEPLEELARRKHLRCVGILGAQRDEKDGGLILPLIDQCLKSGLVVNYQEPRQAFWPSFSHPRLQIFKEKNLDTQTFNEAVIGCDALLVLNDTATFDSRRLSGLTVDALIHGVPVIVPAHTHMSRLCGRFYAGQCYEERTVQSIFSALVSLDKNYAACVAGAQRAAEMLRREHGAARYIDACRGG